MDDVDPIPINDLDAPLFKAKVTQFAGGKVAIGLSWGHVLGDGHAFCHFTKTLSDLYAGKNLNEVERPTFEPHVDLDLQPSEDVLHKWEHPILHPTFPIPEGLGKCEPLMQS